MTHYTGSMETYGDRTLVTLAENGENVANIFAANDADAARILAGWIGVTR